LVKGNEPLGQTTFEGSDVDSKGNVFVGYNYGIYKSVDSGRTFILKFTIPFQPDPWTLMAGRIWCLYIDSRDYVLVSAIGTNRLYRSTDGGESFTEVLNLNRPSNDGGIINMGEDELGNLYACEYGNAKSARLFKSSTGGELGSWSSIRNFDTRHLHNVKMNPYSNWLYVATSEDSGGDTESRSIYRSKDHGASWARVVQQPTSLSGFVAIEFYNDWVVLGEDNAGGYSSIDRFRDDGTDGIFVTQTVWGLNPFATNFYGGTKLGTHLVFATGREGNSGTLYILDSTDSQNWNVIDSMSASSSNDDHRGILNPHPNRNGRIYTCQVAGSAAYYTLGTPPPPPKHIVDGVINPGEYAGGMAVTLVGRTDPTFTVNAFIDWDSQYLYVAVNEPVPPGGGGPTDSWIEFGLDPGPGWPKLEAFVLFCSGAKHEVECPKPTPPGQWGWTDAYAFLAATGTATEFRVKYTDFGIALGNTIKMEIDRNKGPPPPLPYGFAAFWPQNAKAYDVYPDTTTWGDVYLAPRVPTLYIDPSLVAKVPGDVGSTFTVSAMIKDVTDLFGFEIKITWDNTLITFSSLDNTSLTAIWPQGEFQPLPEPGYQTGAGYVNYAAVATGGNGFTGAGTLFKITFHIEKASNFLLTTPIHFDTVKLSDSHWNSISATLTDGQYQMGAGQAPDLEFALVEPPPSKPFEYCKMFEVEVYATHVTDMTDFDLTVLFSSELLRFVDVDYWGVFGTGLVTSTAGSVRVWIGAGAPHTGDRLLLFALTFHVEFDDRIEHIWRTNAPHDLTATVSIKNDVGEFSFVGGPIPITSIVLPPSLTITTHLIRGDVNCDGKVSVLDLRTVAIYFDKTSTDPQWPTISKYDLKMDDTIDIFDLVIIATNFGYPPP
jgi:hypothetical protein